MPPLEYMTLVVMGVWLALELYCACLLPGSHWLRDRCRSRLLNYWRLFAQTSGRDPHTYRLYYRDASTDEWHDAALVAHQPSPWVLFHCPSRYLVTFMFRQCGLAVRTPGTRSDACQLVEEYIIRIARQRSHLPIAIRIVTDAGPNGKPAETLMEHPVCTHDS